MQVEKLDTFSGHRGAVYALEPGLSKENFYSGASDGIVAEWNLAKPDLGSAIAQFPKGIFSLKLDAAQHQLWVATHLDGLQVIDLQTKQVIFQYSNPLASIFSMQIVDNKLFATDSGGVLWVFDLNTKSLVSKVNLGSGSIRKIINFHKDQFLVGSSDGCIRHLDESGKVLKKVLAHDKTVFSMFYEDQSHVLVTVGKDARVKKWSIQEEKIELMDELVGHIFPIHDVVLSPNNTLFATSSMDKTIKIWDLNEFKLLKVIDYARHGGHKNSVNKLYWSDYQDFLISASDDKKISVWKLNS